MKYISIWENETKPMIDFQFRLWSERKTPLKIQAMKQCTKTDSTKSQQDIYLFKVYLVKKTHTDNYNIVSSKWPHMDYLPHTTTEKMYLETIHKRLQQDFGTMNDLFPIVV